MNRPYVDEKYPPSLKLWGIDFFAKKSKKYRRDRLVGAGLLFDTWSTGVAADVVRGAHIRSRAGRFLGLGFVMEPDTTVTLSVTIGRVVGHLNLPPSDFQIRVSIFEHVHGNEKRSL
ncbi:MAG: hypothetical protein Q7S57_01870 [bacterium]|nr:hypothetical protein [bacterium]